MLLQSLSKLTNKVAYVTAKSLFQSSKIRLLMLLQSLPKLTIKTAYVPTKSVYQSSQIRLLMLMQISSLKAYK